MKHNIWNVKLVSEIGEAHSKQIRKLWSQLYIDNKSRENQLLKERNALLKKLKRIFLLVAYSFPLHKIENTMEINPLGGKFFDLPVYGYDGTLIRSDPEYLNKMLKSQVPSSDELVLYREHVAEYLSQVLKIYKVSTISAAQINKIRKLLDVSGGSEFGKKSFIEIERYAHQSLRIPPVIRISKQNSESIDIEHRWETNMKQLEKLKKQMKTLKRQSVKRINKGSGGRP